MASITVAAPLDTVKTRIQNANFERKVHGVTVIKELIKNEGPTAFFKGLTPKVSFAYFVGEKIAQHVLLFVLFRFWLWDPN